MATLAAVVSQLKVLEVKVRDASDNDPLNDGQNFHLLQEFLAIMQQLEEDHDPPVSV